MAGSWRFLVGVLVLMTYLVFGIGYAIMTPPWQNPDEPAHYNYIRQLAAGDGLPVLEMEDYDQVFLEEIVRRGFPPELSVDSLRYENHQPPLYYLLALPVYFLDRNHLLPLRLFSLLLGGCMIALTYLAGRTAVPGRPFVACAAAAFAALLPQHVAMMASINNDALAGLLMALVIYLLLRLGSGRSRGRWEMALLGSVLGLALLCKLTVAICYPLTVLALLYFWRKEGARALSSRRTDMLLILGLPLLIVLPWWLRNVSLYGWPDFLGLVRHGMAVVGQPQTGDWIAAYGFADWLQRLFVFTFQSFWGQFGWMAVPMAPAAYKLLLVFCGLLVIGWLSGRNRDEGRVSAFTDGAVFLLLVSTGLSLLVYLWYNYSFVQHQGRYLYSALVPISLGAAWGWLGLLGRLGVRSPFVSFLGLYGVLFVLNLHALFSVILPHEW